MGLAGVPLAAALTFTTQALGLLTLLNRRFPGLLAVGSTATRAFAGAVTAGLAAFLAMQVVPASAVIAALTSLLAGALVAIPFIWREVRLLMNL